MNCQFCFGPDKRDKAITEKDGKKAIDIAATSGTKKIVFTGGEPLLCSFVFNLLKYAKNKGLFVILHTNGLLLNWDKIKILEKLIDQINLPLDGYDEKTNSQMRLPGHFTVVTSKNKYFISHIGDVLPEFIYKWRVFQFKAEGKAKRFSKELTISSKEFENIKEEVEKKKLKLRVQFVGSDDREFEESYYII
jgi:MoaA/NifB/PqqE/SkfB family radical SAM enzyme